MRHEGFGFISPAQSGARRPNKHSSYVNPGASLVNAVRVWLADEAQRAAAGDDRFNFARRAKVSNVIVQNF